MHKTVSQALCRAVKTLKKHSIESAGIDARLLLSHCLKRSGTFLFTHPEYQLTKEESRRFSSMIRRRRAREPVAYITGRKEFWSRPFVCTRSTLIPRPETELVVETALAFFEKSGRRPGRMLDLGTGTGCIGISLALEWEGSVTILTDIDPAALVTAKQNAACLYAEGTRIHLLCSDWFAGLSDVQKFDLITVNPPYISRQESSLLSDDVICYEPERALFSSRDGLFEIERIFSLAHRYLAPGGIIISEIGWQQGSRVLSLVKDIAVYENIFLVRDLSGNDRVVAATV